MKLNARAAQDYFRKPDPSGIGALICGEDGVRVAEKRKDVVKALVGPTAESEMRLTRLSGADLRKDPALLIDAIKAISFFPGPRLVLLEEATDGLKDVIGDALKAWKEGDAQLVITAGLLTSKSALKKLLEAAPRFAAITLYDDPPSNDEIERMIASAQILPDSEARAALFALSRQLDAGDFRQTVEKIGLYKLGDRSPLTGAEVSALAPQSYEAESDALIAVVALGQREAVALLLTRLYAQGIGPTTLCIALLRHFRQLHAAMASGNVAEGLSRAKPPVFGPRRDAMIQQAQRWSVARVEDALRTILDTDLQLRSTSKAPQQAVVERMLLRLASFARVQNRR